MSLSGLIDRWKDVPFRCELRQTARAKHVPPDFVSILKCFIGILSVLRPAYGCHSGGYLAMHPFVYQIEQLASLFFADCFLCYHPILITYLQSMFVHSYAFSSLSQIMGASQLGHRMGPCSILMGSPFGFPVGCIVCFFFFCIVRTPLNVMIVSHEG